MAPSLAPVNFWKDLSLLLTKLRKRILAIKNWSTIQYQSEKINLDLRQINWVICKNDWGIWILTSWRITIATKDGCYIFQNGLVMEQNRYCCQTEMQ